MFEPQLARPFLRTESFWRHSKYLIPLDRSAFWLRGAPAPTRVMHPDELARQYPDLVRIDSLGHESDCGTIRFRTVYRGQLEVLEAVAHPVFPMRVDSYRNSGAVGRHSSLLGPDNTLVADDGYFLPDATHIRKFPLGRLNPLYWRYRWLGDLRNRLQIPPPRYVEGSVAVLNNPWCHNYYHWMLEVVPRIMLMRRAGLTADWYLVECQGRYQQHALELLGIPPQRWIQPHYGLHLRADLLLRPSQPGPESWRDMSAAIKRKLNIPASGESQPPRRRIYISRKCAAHRKLANEHELEQLLSRYGFESHSFENCDLARQIELLSDAEIIVSVHGAALANLIYAQPGTRVIEICPINRYNTDCFPRISQKMGLEHVTVMAASTRFRQNLSVELDDVQAAFDLVALTEGSRAHLRPSPSSQDLSSQDLSSQDLGHPFDPHRSPQRRAG